MGGSLMYFGRSRRGHHLIDARYWLAVIDDMLLFLPTFDLPRSTTSSRRNSYLTSPEGCCLSSAVARTAPKRGACQARKLCNKVHGRALRLEEPMGCGRQRWPPCQIHSRLHPSILASKQGFGVESTISVAGD